MDETILEKIRETVHERNLYGHTLNRLLDVISDYIEDEKKKNNKSLNNLINNLEILKKEYKEEMVLK